MAEPAFQPIGLQGPQIFGLPVDREVLFSNHKGIYKKRIEKRQRKLIVKLSFLKPFLKNNEHIQLVTTGYSPLNSLAQYLTGFIFIYLKRSLFVFTNYRILHIPATSSYKYNNSIAQVIIFTPIFLPVITTVGISPIHFAIIFVVNAEVGFLTPPLGTNLFVSMEIADSNLGGVAKSVIPLLGVLFLMILVIILFPQISLLLPELLAR